MLVELDLDFAKEHSIHEAVFLAFLKSHSNSSSLDLFVIGKELPFFSPDILLKIVARLNSKRLHGIVLKGSEVHYEFGKKESISISSELGSGATNFLKRFGQQPSFLEKVIQENILSNKHDYINHAIGFGLDPSSAESLLDKFISYLRANANKTWDKDMAAYWDFWLKNNDNPTTKRGKVSNQNQQVKDAWLNR